MASPANWFALRDQISDVICLTILQSKFSRRFFYVKLNCRLQAIAQAAFGNKARGTQFFDGGHGMFHVARAFRCVPDD